MSDDEPLDVEAIGLPELVGTGPGLIPSLELFDAATVGETCGCDGTDDPGTDADAMAATGFDTEVAGRMKYPSPTPARAEAREAAAMTGQIVRLVRLREVRVPTPAPASWTGPAGTESAIQSCQPPGGGGHDGSGSHPVGGVHPGGGAGQLGGGLNRIDSGRGGTFVAGP